MSTTALQTAPAPEKILSVNNIEVLYDHVILVLKGVSLDVDKGGIVALLGANGAGKTTTLKAISNLLHSERGEVTKGSIVFEGAEVQSLSPNELVRRGCIQVMEGRHCFGHLTIEENLLTGAFTRKDGRAAIARDLELVYGYFKRLRERRDFDGGLYVGRRAADVRDRPRADVAAEDDPARRAVDGAGAADRRRDFRDRERSEREGECVVPAGRAEHQHGAEICALRLHPGERPRGDGRRRQVAGARTRTSRNSTSASPRASASRSAMASITSGASGGWRNQSSSRAPCEVGEPGIHMHGRDCWIAGSRRLRRVPGNDGARSMRMTDHYDSLETRDPAAARARDLRAACPI